MMNEKCFHGGVEKLRSDERRALLSVERIVTICFEEFHFSSLLDIGTGSGLFAEAFQKRGVSVVGADLRQEMLTAARQFVINRPLVQASAEAVPFREGSFGLIVLAHILHEVDDQVATMIEARRLSQTAVVIVEWPYVEEEQGPPIGHRLRPERIIELGRIAQLQVHKITHLGRTVLYLFTPEESMNS